MKKYLIMTLVVAMVLGVGSMGFALTEDADEGLDQSPAFEGDPGHFTHENGAPRFDTDNGRMTIEPAEAGDNSADESAVDAHGGDSLIDTR